MRAASATAWVSAVLALGIGGCGGGSDAVGVSTSGDDATGDDVTDGGGAQRSDAARDEPVTAPPATDDGDPLETDSDSEVDETLPMESDAATPLGSASSADDQTQPNTTDLDATAPTSGSDAGVTANPSTPAEASAPAEGIDIVEDYAESGYCSVYLEQGERGHRIDCTLVVGDVWSCISFTPVAPYAEFYLADQQSYTVNAPPAQNVCSLLVEPLFGQSAVAFTGDGDDCEPLAGSVGPSRWQTQVCGPKTTLDSDFVAWEGEPGLVATCERPATQSTAPICSCSQSAVERKYVANEGDDVATALAAAWTYCSAPETPSLTGALTCDPHGSTSGDNFCMIDTTCSQPEQKSAAELTLLRHFEKRVTCAPVEGADESTVQCTCEGAIDGLANISFAANDGTVETCEEMFELCSPAEPESAGAAECTVVDEYQVEQEGCGIALSCSVPLFINGAYATTTTKANMYCNEISDTTLTCSSGAARPQSTFEVTDVDFATACDTARARFIEESEQAPRIAP